MAANKKDKEGGQQEDSWLQKLKERGSKRGAKRDKKEEQKVRKKTREAKMIRSEDKKQGSKYTEEGKKEETCK